MVKAFFNRYQDQIVIVIWIIGIIISIFFFTNKEKYYLIPGSVVHGTYQGRPITYCKYIHDNVEGYIGFSNISIDFCSNNPRMCEGHPNDPFSRKALKGNWNKYEKQGYFAINHKWQLGFVTIACCILFMGLVFSLTGQRWQSYYSKYTKSGYKVNNLYCNFQSCEYISSKNEYHYHCNLCSVKDYCKYSDCPNKVFKYIRVYKKIFLGY